MKTGDFSGARKHFDIALELRYPYPDCVYNLGSITFKSNYIYLHLQISIVRQRIKGGGGGEVLTHLRKPGI